MTLPNGRKMRYEKVRVVCRVEKDKDTGLPKKVSVFQANTDGRWKGYYGGKLTENLVQATARDVFAEQMLAMQKNGWENLFSAHDEAILEVDQDVTAKDVEHEMSKCPDWMPGCPIAAEAKEVPHYLK
jgi:DNA polymerase